MYNFAAVLVKWFVNTVFRIEVFGEENIPESGACMVCINHISAWDPLVVGLSVKRQIRFLAKNELFSIPVVGWFIKSMGSIPVKRNSGDIGAMRTALGVFKSGNVLGIFPTGTRERKHKNAPVKPGVALIAAKSDVPVIPIHIITNYRLFSRVKIVIGEPVDIGDCGGKLPHRDELEKIADKIYKSILSLGD